MIAQNEHVEEARKETADIMLINKELGVGFSFIGASFSPHVSMLKTKVALKNKKRVKKKQNIKCPHKISH